MKKKVKLRLNKVAHLINRDHEILRYERVQQDDNSLIIRGYNHDFACLDSELLILEEPGLWRVTDFMKSDEKNILFITLRKDDWDGSL